METQILTSKEFNEKLDNEINDTYETLTDNLINALSNMKQISKLKKQKTKIKVLENQIEKK